MCIAVYKPEGIVLKEETIKNCFDNNPDGAGFATIVGDELYIKKGLYTLEDFNREYAPYKDKQCILHFRIRTHGDMGEENTHPHLVSPKLAFIHNGVINNVGIDAVKSDTVLFNETILKNLVTRYGKRAIFDSTIQQLIEEKIGWSKLVFLEASGKFVIYNEAKGNWNSGCWFSNTSWERPKVFTVSQSAGAGSTTTSGGTSTDDGDAIARSVYQYKNGLPHKRTVTRRDGRVQVYVRSEAGGKVLWSLESTQFPKKRKEKERVKPELQRLAEQARQTHKDPIYLRDFVTTNIDWGDIPDGTTGQVLGFYASNEIEVYFPLHGISHKIPYYYLTKLEEKRSNVIMLPSASV